MKNRERYGKGKSWDVRIHEDGIYSVHLQIDAPAYKEEHAVTITHFEDVDREQLGHFLVELGESVLRVASGEITPHFIVEDGNLLEPGDADWPF